MAESVKASMRGVPASAHRRARSIALAQSPKPFEGAKTTVDKGIARYGLWYVEAHEWIETHRARHVLAGQER